MVGDNKEVLFGKFCPECEFAEKSENEEPCDECLEQFYNQDSHKPVKFKEKSNGDKK